MTPRHRGRRCLFDEEENRMGWELKKKESVRSLFVSECKPDAGFERGSYLLDNRPNATHGDLSTLVVRYAVLLHSLKDSTRGGL